MLESYFRKLEQEDGGATSQMKRSWYHATGLFFRAGFLYGVVLSCKLLGNTRIVDAGTFVALITFDFGVIAYSSLA